MLLIVDAQKLAHPFLTDHIQSDCRFIQKKYSRLMDERRDQFHFHAFAQGKFAHHHVHSVSHFQKFCQPSDDLFEPAAVDSVDRAIELERFLRGQVPPERIFLSHEQTKLALHLIASFPRNKAQHARLTRSRVQQARKHFQHCSFAGAVRAEKTDKLAFVDSKRDFICGARLIVSPPYQSFDRTREPTLFAVSAIDLR